MTSSHTLTHSFGISIGALLLMPVGQAEDVIQFDPDLGELPESVVVDDAGVVYASLSAKLAVAKIHLDGRVEELLITQAALPEGALGALGIAVDGHGNDEFTHLDAFVRHLDWRSALDAGRSGRGRNPIRS